MPAESDSQTATTQADSSAAGQASFTEHADKRAAAHTFESRNVDSDIGQGEAWSINMKRMYDDFAHSQERVHTNDLRATDNLQKIFEQDWAARLADERIAYKSYVNASANSWNNLTDEEKRVMAQETRHHDLAVDRQWNVDEQGQMAILAIRELASSGQLTTDALVAGIKAVFDGVNK